jgi:hypothetical protein
VNGYSLPAHAVAPAAADAKAAAVPVPVSPAICKVALAPKITGATALSGFSDALRGVSVGTQIVGLYMAGSSVNELDVVLPAELPRVSGAYTNAGDAGYQYLDKSGALGDLMPTMVANLKPLAPSERNAWDGGIFIFFGWNGGAHAEGCYQKWYRKELRLVFPVKRRQCKPRHDDSVWHRCAGSICRSSTWFCSLGNCAGRPAAKLELCWSCRACQQRSKPDRCRTTLSGTKQHTSVDASE